MNNLRLSPTQQKIVDHGDGPLLVVAGPGSGKTRVLTERVRRLLTQVPGHFRVLALTFTNKAANEMSERLDDLGDARRKATVSTLHGFCLEMLQTRGHFIGINGEPHIFESAKDRKQILLEAAMDDPMLSQVAENWKGGRAKLLDQWLTHIAKIKAHPLSQQEKVENDPIVMAYDAGLRACNAFDFDDLLLLTYKLLTEFPKIADLYRRIYGYICIDEAQDLNEAQYAVLVALCGEDFRNIMMVGDPKQSIYNFNNASDKYMRRFHKEFQAEIIQLKENFRSSKVVVEAAKRLNQKYVIDDQLGYTGEIELNIGDDEGHEANLVCDKLQQLFVNSHPDVENGIAPSQCAVLGRNQYVLIEVEKKFRERNIPYYKRLSSIHEYKSPVVREFHLALRICANPRDRLHMNALAKEWSIKSSLFKHLQKTQDVPTLLRKIAEQTANPQHMAIVEVLDKIHRQTQGLNISACIEILHRFANTQTDEDRRTIYEDTEVLLDEWDRYLRSGTGSSKTIAGFMSNMALGTTRQSNQNGVALLSVHASKGLEFDVVFMVGMVDGVFPDYRAKDNPASLAEEERNAFVAVTRSKRLLYLSYAKTRKMPWNDIWNSDPSPYLHLIGLT